MTLERLGQMPNVPDLTIYGPTISTFVRIVSITAEEKGLTWETIPTAAKSEEQRTRHPFQRAPAVDFGDEKLFETDAITRYIDEAFEGPALQPATPRARAEMQKWISVMQHYFFPATAIGLVAPRLLAPAQGAPVDENLVQRALPTIKYQISLVDAHLSVNPFFAGDQPCLADFYQQVCWWSVFLTPEGKQLLAACPNTSRWLGFMMARGSARATAWPDEAQALSLLQD